MMALMMIIIMNSKNNNTRNTNMQNTAPHAYTPPVAVQANACSVPYAILQTHAHSLARSYIYIRYRLVHIIYATCIIILTPHHNHQAG